MAEQNHYFVQYAPERTLYAIERYINETHRPYGVLNRRLGDREFIAGENSIADIACYPWIFPHEHQQQSLGDFPHLQRWFKTVQARPAVQRAYARAKEINHKPVVSDISRGLLSDPRGETSQ